MYGGMSEIDAWKMVTLNPAKLLHLDKNMGSVARGKDADLVLWSDNPLSVYAQVEYTWVDGTCFFSRTDHNKKVEYIATERNRLVQKMILAKKNGAATQKSTVHEQHLYHCDDIACEVAD